MADEVEYTKSTAQLDLEAFQAREKARAAGKRAPEEEGRSFAVEDNDLDGYIGVSPEYQNYADETHAPLSAEKSAEAVVENRVAEHLEDLTEQSRQVGLHGHRPAPKRADAVEAQESRVRRGAELTAAPEPESAAKAPAKATAKD